MREGKMINAEIIKSRQNREGMLRRSLERIIQLYKDKVHFIYELLQNAEDAQAHSVKFALFDDRLEVFHDGKPFTVSNVQSLFDIGLSDKVNDLNQIGEFGVGFKSVFSICERVQFFSAPNNFREKQIESAGSFGFEIQDFYNPVDIPIVDFGSAYTTKFIFPFAVDKPFLGFKKIEELRSTIKNKLENMSETTLLFMKNIETIEYEINLNDEYKSGRYMLDKRRLNDHCCCIKTLAYRSDESDTSKEKTQEISYIVFSRKTDESVSQRSVDIAFSFVEDDKEWHFIPTNEKHIFVYFPTGTESKLNFIVQGPYRTTPSRSEIPMDDPDNLSFADKTASLLYDCILELQAMGKINLSLLNILPLDEEDFYNIVKYTYGYGIKIRERKASNNILSALYDKTIELFKREQILPCKQGGFTDAKHGRLLRSKELSEVFNDDTLTLLLEEEEKIHWLAEEITENSQAYKNLSSYLIATIGVKRITPDDLPRYLEKNSEFLSAKKEDVEWLIKFYNFLSSIPAQFNQARNGAMLTVQFVMTDKGQFVAPYRKSGEKYLPNIFLPLDGYETQSDELVFVAPSIYNSCKTFFEDVLHLVKPKEYDVWVKALQQHLDSVNSLSDEQHINDVKMILKYLKHPDYHTDLKSVLQAKFHLKCHNKEGKKWSNPYNNNIYFPEDKDGIKLEEYFRNIADYDYIDYEFYSQYDISYDDLRQLNVCDNIVEGADITSGEYNNGKPGKNPTWNSEGKFRWRWTLSCLAKVLNYIEKNAAKPDAKLKSAIIFKLLMQNEECLNGKITFSGYSTQPREENALAVRKILFKRPENYDDRQFLQQWTGKWLFTKDDKLVSSTEISKYDLNEQLYGNVKLDSKLYEILKFKKDDRDIKEQELKDYNALPVEKRDAYGIQWLKECYGITPEQLSHMLDHAEHVGDKQGNSFDFPEDNIKNWDSVERHAEQMFAYAEPVLYAEKVRSVRVSKNVSAVKTYLQQMYRLMGNQGRFACQLCHQTFTSIESCQLDEKGDADKELEPLHLCLCPNCAAKFRAYRNSPEYSNFRDRLHSLTQEDITEESPVKIKLATEEIWFTQRHIAEIVALLKLQEEMQKE